MTHGSLVDPLRWYLPQDSPAGAPAERDVWLMIEWAYPGDDVGLGTGAGRVTRADAATSAFPATASATRAGCVRLVALRGAPHRGRS